jgi:hypothetical protein
VVATYGRGLYILDDITPLRSLSDAVLNSDFYLFEPRPAYRFQPIYGIKTEGFGSRAGGSTVTGSNPSYGADINFYLKDESEKPVRISFLDADNNRIRSLLKKGKAGINRIWWDLRHEPIRKAKLRTAPPGKPWVPLRPDGTRIIYTWDLDLRRGQLGPLAPPGTYTVKVSVGDKELTRPLIVLKDPHSSGTEEDIRAQVAFSLELRDALNEVVDMINEIEWLRKQLEDLQARLKDKKDVKSVVDAADELEDSAIGVEARLFDVNLTGAREDSFRGPMKLYGRLSALASDISGWGADFPPTEQQRQVYEVLEGRLDEAREQYEVLMTDQVDALNDLLTVSQLGGVTVRP